MWSLGLPWWEFILRVTGKRQTGQLAPFDLVLLLVLSNAVQNAMNGGDNSVLGGIISATTLIHNGILNEDVMRGELLTGHELAAALRAAGCAEMEHIHVATLENNGQITVSLRPNPA
jgi:uncharacterized membrane protein YcaP (DUF421 family)